MATGDKKRAVMEGDISYVNPEMFGARGDGIADDTQALRNALNSGKTVMLDAGTYRITGTLTVPAGCTISGNKNCIISPECQTVFHLKESTVLTGFSVNVNSEKVLTVFEVNDDSSVGDSLMKIIIENVTVINSTAVVPDMYTVCHFHTEAKGIYDISVRECTFDNSRSVGGYVSRVYAEGDAWLSTVIFDGNWSRHFKWHYFFDKAETEFVNVHAGQHIVSNCIAQCAEETNGFIFTSVLNCVHLKNNSLWDWTTSINCNGRWFVISPNVRSAETLFVQQFSHNDIRMPENICVFDGTTFTHLPSYRHDVVSTVGGHYPPSLIPKFIGLAKVNTVCLYKNPDATVNDRTRVRFYWVDTNGITYISIIPTKQKMYVSQPISDSIFFGVSSDYRRVYVYRKEGVTLTSTTGILTNPVHSGAMTIGGNAIGLEKTANFCEFLDTCFYDALPEEVLPLSKYLAQPAYASDANGAIYKLTVVDGTDGKELSIERASIPQDEWS